MKSKEEQQHEQEHKIHSIEGISPDEIFIKSVGREEVDWSVHAHSKHQLIYTLSGTLHITVGAERHFITARHLVWIPAGTPHQLSSNNAQISLIVCYFSHSERIGDSFSIFVVNEFLAINLAHIAARGVIDQRQSPELFGFLRHLFALIPLECEQATFSLQPFMVAQSHRLYPVLAYIDRNYADDLSVASVARQFALSVRNLTRMFTHADIHFISYLNHVRVVRALELLADNEMSIEQIAYEVGFNSPNSFNRVFKKITGHAPSYYFPRT